jgi:uncharacterized protein YhbP (UPF0306 family)
MQINIMERVKMVLKNATHMHLGTQDEKGVWVSTVFFLYNEEKNIIYFQSNPDTRHSKVILNFPEVSASIVLNDGMIDKKELAIQLSGICKKIEGVSLEASLLQFEKRKCKERGKPIPEDKNGLWLDYSWYKIELENIDLIDRENFELVKNKLNLINS